MIKKNNNNIKNKEKHKEKSGQRRDNIKRSKMCTLVSRLWGGQLPFRRLLKL